MFYVWGGAGWQGNRAALCAGSDQAGSECSAMLPTRQDKLTHTPVLLIN